MKSIKLNPLKLLVLIGSLLAPCSIFSHKAQGKEVIGASSVGKRLPGIHTTIQKPNGTSVQAPPTGSNGMTSLQLSVGKSIISLSDANIGSAAAAIGHQGAYNGSNVTMALTPDPKVSVVRQPNNKVEMTVTGSPVTVTLTVVLNVAGGPVVKAENKKLAIDPKVIKGGGITPTNPTTPTNPSSTGASQAAKKAVSK